MPQIIYTGKDYQKPVQSQGRALQALGQFTQQQEMRKQADLERSRKDRDTFARLMEMDPVYATSAKIQQQMAAEMDSYIDAMTEVNKGMQGRAMNTQDIMRMQQEKARVMGRLGQLKSWDTEINKAANLVKTRPDLYDTRMFNEAFQEFRDTGVFPEEGMLFPLVKDPFEEYNKYAYEHVRTSGGVDDVPGSIVQYPEGGGHVPYTRIYPGQKQWPEERVHDLFLNSPASYHVQGSFDRLSDAEKEPFLQQAGGNQAVAANQWFKQGASGSTYPEHTYDKPFKATAYESSGLPRTFAEKEEAKTYVTENDIQMIGGEKAFSKANVTGAIVAKDGKEGIRFASNAPTLSIPAGQLTFSDEELTLDPDARVWVRPNIAADGQIEFAVDTKETGMVTKIVDKIADMPLDLARNKKFTIIKTPGGKTRYAYKERVPENLSAVGDLKTVAPMLKTDYEGLFEKRYEEWFGGEAEKSKVEGGSSTPSEKATAIDPEWSTRVSRDDADKINKFIKNNAAALSSGDSRWYEAANILLDNGYITYPKQ